MPIVTMPDGTEIEFPETMSQQEIQGVLQKQFPPQQAQSGQLAEQFKMMPELPAPSPYGAEGFAPVYPEQKSIGSQIGKGMIELAPAGGAMAGAGLGAMSGAAAGGVGAIPGALIGAILGGAAGVPAKYIGKGLMGEKVPTMTETLPEMASTGLWSGVGEGIFPAGKEIGTAVKPWLTSQVSKIFAPAWNVASAGLTQTKEFLKAKGLPMPADIFGTGVGKVSQWLANSGLGGFLVDRQKRKMVEGLASAADEVMGSLGGKTMSEAAHEGASALASLGNMEMTYTQFNQALKSLPKDTLYEMPGVLQALESLGKGAGTKEGIKALEKIYSGKKGMEARAAIQRIIEQGGANVDDLMVLSRDVRRGMGGKGEFAADRMKRGLLEDLENILTPSGENLKTLRIAADKVMSDTYTFLREIGEQTGLVFKGQRGGWQPTNRMELGPSVERLFKSDYAPVTERLRENLIANGMGDTWDGIKMAYLREQFEKATPALGQAGERVFQPGKFLDWFNKNGKTAMKLMPEHAENITLWANISRNMLSEMKKKPMSTEGRLAMAASLGGAGYAAGGTGGMAVPALFSPLAAIFTMYPRVSFLTKYATKSNIGTAAGLAAELPAAFGRKAIQDYGPMSLQSINERFKGETP